MERKLDWNWNYALHLSHLGVSCGLGGRLFVPCPPLLLLKEATIAGIAKLFAELTRFSPCAKKSPRLALWPSPGFGASNESSELQLSIAFESPTSVTLNSGFAAKDEEEEELARELGSAAEPHTVEFWHLFIHFLWQHIWHAVHWTASLSQIWGRKRRLIFR